MRLAALEISFTTSAFSRMSRALQLHDAYPHRRFFPPLAIFTTMRPKTTPLATALTATAASTSALFALQHHADAAIVYSGVQNITAAFTHLSYGGGNASQGFQLGTRAMNLQVQRVPVFGNYSGVAAIMGSGVNWIGNNQNFHSAKIFLKKLGAGSVISGGKINLHYSEVLIQGGFGGSVGSWQKGQPGLAGFQLPNGDFGWIRLEWNSTDSFNRANSITAIDWAYDTTSGETINAGQTSSVPEPSAAALLALAGAGAAFLRRKRAA
jgi:hypothetical protein